MRASRADGWQGLRVDGEMVDLCPACVTDTAPTSECPYPEPCGYEVAGLLGHDIHGHRIARYLVRHYGLKSVCEVREWEAMGWLRELPAGTRRRLLGALKS